MYLNKLLKESVSTGPSIGDEKGCFDVQPFVGKKLID